MFEMDSGQDWTINYPDCSWKSTIHRTATRSRLSTEERLTDSKAACCAPLTALIEIPTYMSVTGR
jgi:hypothetical protein